MALIATAACFIFSSRSPLGDSVLNDSTRPLVSIVTSKAILLVPDSRNFGAAASHIAWGGFPFPSSAEPSKAILKATSAGHKAILFIARTVRQACLEFQWGAADVGWIELRGCPRFRERQRELPGKTRKTFQPIHDSAQVSAPKSEHCKNERRKRGANLGHQARLAQTSTPANAC